MNLRRKTLLIVTPIVAAPLFLLWAVTHMALRPALRDAESIRAEMEELVTLLHEARQEARRRFESATSNAYAFGLANIGANLDGTLDAMEKSLRVSSKRPEVVDLLARPEQEEGRASVSAYLEDLMIAHELARAALVDRSGAILLDLERVPRSYDPLRYQEDSPRFRLRTELPSVSDRRWYQQIRQSSEETAWDLYRMRVGDENVELPGVSGAARVVTGEEGTVIGYIRFFLPVAILAREIRGPEELVSRVRLVDAAGEEYWSQAGAHEASHGEETLSIGQSIRGGLLQAQVDLLSSVAFVNLAPFDRLSEALDLKVDRVESTNAALEERVEESSLLVFAVKLVLAAIALGLLFYFLGRVASRIESLNGAALRISDGDLDASLPAFGSEDELETLRRNIDRMRLRIKGQIEKLDRKVAERTKELNAANQRLEVEVRDRRKAEEAALAASRAKSDFLATMSHEIRTPLSGIFGGTHLLLKSDLDSDQRVLAEVVENSTQTLQSLVNDILDFSKIEAGKLTLDEQPFDVASSVREVCDTFRFKAEEKKLELSFEDQARDSILRVGDSTRLKQIIFNLVGNAVKFTRAGSIKVSLSVADEDKSLVRIVVEDTGIGMDEAIIERVFDSFTQADSSISREYGGTGLGLAISSRLATLMRGKLEVESRSGEGSRFMLRVPLPYAVTVGEETRGGRAIRRDAAQGSILFAEDNSSNRMILSRMLESTGFRVTEVEDGRACVEKAKAADYDLVLMDCSMPVMDGCAATRAIREAERGSQGARKLIVGLTANATAEQRRECFDSGMDDVLFKPLSGPMLVETCMRLIEESRVARGT